MEEPEKEAGEKMALEETLKKISLNPDNKVERDGKIIIKNCSDDQCQGDISHIPAIIIDTNPDSKKRYFEFHNKSAISALYSPALRPLWKFFSEYNYEANFEFKSMNEPKDPYLRE